MAHVSAMSKMARPDSGKRPPRTPRPPPRRAKSSVPAPLTNRPLAGTPRPPGAPPPPGALPPPPPGAPGGAGAGPPPPPLRVLGKNRAPPCGGGGDRMRRAPEIIEFYQSMMRRGEAKQAAARGVPKASGSSKDACRDMVGEITKNSPHLLASRDPGTGRCGDTGGFVQTLATEVREASFTNIEEVVAFVIWLDEELSFLVDERAVLKHFEWPEKRADTLRDAAAKYLGLLKLEKQVLSFVDDRTLHRDAALGKMYSLFEKTEQSVHKFLQDRDNADLKNNLVSRYKEQEIPVDWMSDAGLIVKIKLARVNLAKQYMIRVVSELDKEQNKEAALFQRLKGQNREVLLHQGARFAFRVHQFAGGFTTESMVAFEALRRRHVNRTS